MGQAPNIPATAEQRLRPASASQRRAAEVAGAEAERARAAVSRPRLRPRSAEGGREAALEGLVADRRLVTLREDGQWVVAARARGAEA